MNASSPQIGLENRRQFLRRLASGVVVVSGGAMLLNRMDSAAFAEALTQTPWQTEGPFFPTKCRSTPITTSSSTTKA